MKVLVGVDGGAAQADALRLAAQLAAIEPGRLIVATTRTDAGRVLDLADEQLADVPHELRPVPGTAPAEALHDLARSEGVDVLVVGSTHRGRMGRTLLGTTGDHVVHGSPCPVAIAPRGYGRTGADRAIGHVALAFDGCRESRAALDWLRPLAERAGAQVTVVSVADPVGFAIDPALPALTSDDVIVSMRKSRAEELDEIVRKLPAGVHAAGRLLEGPVVVALAEASGDYDLLVCGSRDHGTVGHALLGSVSRKLMHESAAPLVIVPRSARHAGVAAHTSEEAHAG